MEWLPVFIQRKSDYAWSGEINIFDFFCGPGIDKDGQKGSPLIALDVCKQFSEQLAQQGRKVNLFFSDDKPSKVKKLNIKLSEIELPDTIVYDTKVEKFPNTFMRKLKSMSGAANLLFIDQCGIKGVPDNVFKALISLNGTDFLFFIASSFFKRFKDLAEFKQYIDTTDYITDNTPYSDMHRAIASMYRSFIPSDEEYYLIPFTIKKGANIYGLIFGTRSLLGASKFMKICWDIDSERGEANFDIDNDNLPSKPGDMGDLFKDNEKSQKVTLFQAELENKLLGGKFATDKQIFVYSLESDVLPTKHAKPVVTRLIKEGRISCVGSPRLSKSCIAEPRLLNVLK